MAQDSGGMVTAWGIAGRVVDLAEESDLRKVREFLGRHPLAVLAEVSIATGVLPSRILRMVDTGKLTLRIR